MDNRVRYVSRGALLAAGAFTTTLAAEMLVAVRHKFIPSEPVLEISGVIGPEDGEPFTVAVLGDSSVAGVGAERAEDTLTYGVAQALADRYRVVLHARGISLADVESELDRRTRQSGLDEKAARKGG